MNDLQGQANRNTILILGINEATGNTCVLVLSADRTKWIEVQLELPFMPWHSGAVYLNGELYLIGGWKDFKALYKLDNNLKWIRLPDMNAKREEIRNNCLEWNGCIWVFGGSEKIREENSPGVIVKPLKSVEKYDPKENKWTLMPDMLHPRSEAAAIVWNDRVVISGSQARTHAFDDTDSLECFKDGRWIEFQNMPRYLHAHSFVSYKEKLMIMGGSDRRTYNEVWEVDPHRLFRTSFFNFWDAEWTPLMPMKKPARSFVGIVLDEEIYAIGGYEMGGDAHSHVEIFDGKQWRDGPPLPFPMFEVPAVIIPQTLADRLCNL